MLKKFFDALFKNTGHKQYLYIIFIIGTVIMLCGGFGAKKFDVSKKNTAAAESGVEISESDDEKRLKEILSKIKGVGETEVMISYENENIDAQYKAVFAQNGENKKTKPRGVVVVCRGANETAVRQKIVEAVCAFTGVYEHNVAVFEKK